MIRLRRAELKGSIVEINNRYGKLIVTSKILKVIRGKTYNRYSCLCDCGNSIILTASTLLSKDTTSCGCTHNTRITRFQPNEEKTRLEHYNNYKSSAKKRKLDFLLSREEFFSICDKPCNYCGEAGSLKSQDYKYIDRIKTYFDSFYIRNGIDRINSKFGYTLNNTVPCCTTCNYMKSNRSVEKFLEQVEKIANFQKSKNYDNQS